jgi:hypothetical protein
MASKSADADNHDNPAQHGAAVRIPPIGHR